MEKYNKKFAEWKPLITSADKEEAAKATGIHISTIVSYLNGNGKVEYVAAEILLHFSKVIAEKKRHIDNALSI